MKQFLTISFPAAGRTYQMSTAPIFAALTQWALAGEAKGNPDEAHQLAKKVIENGDALAIWMRDNTTWQQLLPMARLIKANVRDMNIANAELSLGDELVAAAEVRGDEFMELPVASIVTKMAESGNTVAICGIHGQDDKLAGAVVLVQGPGDVVSGYIGVINQFAGFLEEHARRAKEALLGEADKRINGSAAQPANDESTKH